MRWREIAESASAGATCSGSMSVAEQPMGMISRTGSNLLLGKYTTDPTPNTPGESKRLKQHARGRFKNSIGN